MNVNLLRVATLVVCLNGMFAEDPLSAKSGPPVSLDSRSPHLMISTEGWIPKLKFFNNSALKGSPVFQLDAEGLRRGEKVLCRWPGGRFDLEKSYNMVLGYYDVDTGEYEGCGEGGPILSTWGDGGTGTAVLYIRISKRNGSIITTTHQGKDYYFDLNTIPKKNWEWLEAGNDFSSDGD